MRPSLLAVLLLAVFTSGCGSDGPPECEPGPSLPDVNITLLDAQAAPVCNGVVTLVSAARTYEMRGRDDLCNLHSAHVAPDTYTLTASAEGFTTASGCGVKVMTTGVRPRNSPRPFSSSRMSR